MKLNLVALVVFIVLCTACGTNKTYRSADFNGDRVYSKRGSHTPQLREHDVLGLTSAENISDADIQRVLDQTRSLRIKPGSKVLLVQSGAPAPDAIMVQELSKHFTVVPHTGVPSEVSSESGPNVAKALRLAAAHSNAETILVYWGNLEMKRNDLPTSIVSWVPVVDFTVPDEHQTVRMSLKLALVDVRTGNWATFRTEPIEEESLTTRYARERELKWPLERTKQKLYETAVKKLNDGYVAAL